MSRELYDLCRKYKYFYNKHQDVKRWDKKYHDVDLSDAIAKTRVDLGLVEHEIQMELFKIFDVKCEEIEIQTIMDSPFGVSMGDKFRCRCVPLFHQSSANVEFKDSNRFLNVLSEYITQRRDFYDW